jgi:hypothetical protein
MTHASPHPRFLLCARCSKAALADDAPGWGRVRVPVDETGEHDFAVCPECALSILEFLRSTP